MAGRDALRKRSTTARRAAEDAAAVELTEWCKAEKARLEAQTDLTPAERAAAERALTVEFGRRSKRALDRAKRQSLLPRLLEQDARDAIAARTAGEP